MSIIEVICKWYFTLRMTYIKGLLIERVNALEGALEVYITSPASPEDISRVMEEITELSIMSFQRRHWYGKAALNAISNHLLEIRMLVNLGPLTYVPYALTELQHSVRGLVTIKSL